MTYYGPEELARSFRTVRKNTRQIATEIPELQYGFRPSETSRLIAETLVHIALAPRLQEQIQSVERRTTLVGFDFMGFHGELAAQEKTERTKDEILELLHTEGERYAQMLESFPEEALGETVTYPEGMEPPVKSRFEMLLGPKEHEMHHRAQLMVVQRMLGQTPHLTRRMQERVAAMQATRTAAN